MACSCASKSIGLQSSIAEKRYFLFIYQAFPPKAFLLLNFRQGLLTFTLFHLPVSSGFVLKQFFYVIYSCGDSSRISRDSLFQKQSKGTFLILYLQE